LPARTANRTTCAASAVGEGLTAGPEDGGSVADGVARDDVPAGGGTDADDDADASELGEPPEHPVQSPSASRPADNHPATDRDRRA
jgi:hypothetical protein